MGTAGFGGQNGTMATNSAHPDSFQSRTRLTVGDQTFEIFRLGAEPLASGNDVARRLFEPEDLREYTWNPLLANPGQAIYMLLARDYAPLPERLQSLAGRLAAVPDSLAAARSAARIARVVSA